MKFFISSVLSTLFKFKFSFLHLFKILNDSGVEIIGIKLVSKTSLSTQYLLLFTSQIILFYVLFLL